MNSRIRPKLSSGELISLNNDLGLLIRPETGTWVVLDNVGINIIKSLSGTKSVHDLIEDHAYLAQYSEIIKLVNILHDKGFLEDSHSCEETNHPVLQPTLAVLKLTQDCNLACRYCYVSAGKSTGKMSLKTALRIADEMLKFSSNSEEKVKLLFHGGEPLLNFRVIEAVVEHIASSAADRFLFEIQTNATLLTKKHIEFFKKHHFTIGVSLDGPGNLHNITRSYKNGRGSFDKVVKGINLLQKNSIDFGVLVILTSANVDHIEEIFNLLSDLNIQTFSLNPFFPAGAGKKATDLSLDGVQLFKAYQSLTCKLIEFNSKCQDIHRQMEERTLKYLTRNITLQDNSYMCMRTPCGAGINTIGFDVNGDVYVCDDFVTEPDFKLGNIHQQTLNEIFDQNKKIDSFISKQTKNTSRCSQCSWRELCKGLCPAHLYFETKLDHPECQFRQLIIPFLIELLSTGALAPQLLDRDWPVNRPKHLYFNINYTCNNRCVFCASDITSEKSRPEIDLATFKSLLELNSVSLNDHVTINGGEPTLTPHLNDILSFIHEKGASVHLFTNGRKLSQESYCREILETGVDKISIPLYGTTPKEHDELTVCQGSFEQTIAGIQNVLRFREKLEKKVILELKLLFMQPTLARNPKILEFMVQQFPEVDYISLNSLIVSRVVLKQSNQLIASPTELMESINNTLDFARSNGIESQTRLNDIPYCLIEKRNWGFLPSPEGEMRYDDKYFDPSCIGGKQAVEKIGLLPSICNRCVYIKRCGFINRLCLDNFVNSQSISAIFPEKGAAFGCEG